LSNEKIDNKNSKILDAIVIFTIALVISSLLTFTLIKTNEHGLEIEATVGRSKFQLYGLVKRVSITYLHNGVMSKNYVDLFFTTKTPSFGDKVHIKCLPFPTTPINNGYFTSQLIGSIILDSFLLLFLLFGIAVYFYNKSIKKGEET
jgi:hypothetical protein